MKQPEDESKRVVTFATSQLEESRRVLNIASNLYFAAEQLMHLYQRSCQANGCETSKVGVDKVKRELIFLLNIPCRNLDEHNEMVSGKLEQLLPSFKEQASQSELHELASTLRQVQRDLPVRGFDDRNDKGQYARFVEAGESRVTLSPFMEMAVKHFTPRGRGYLCSRLPEINSIKFEEDRFVVSSKGYRPGDIFDLLKRFVTCNSMVPFRNGQIRGITKEGGVLVSQQLLPETNTYSYERFLENMGISDTVQGVKQEHGFIIRSGPTMYVAFDMKKDNSGQYGAGVSIFDAIVETLDLEKIKTHPNYDKIKPIIGKREHAPSAFVMRPEWSDTLVCLQRMKADFNANVERIFAARPGNVIQFPSVVSRMHPHVDPEMVRKPRRTMGE